VSPAGLFAVWAPVADRSRNSPCRKFATPRLSCPVPPKTQRDKCSAEACCGARSYRHRRRCTGLRAGRHRPRRLRTRQVQCSCERGPGGRIRWPSVPTGRGRNLRFCEGPAYLLPGLSGAIGAGRSSPRLNSRPWHLAWRPRPSFVRVRPASRQDLNRLSPAPVRSERADPQACRPSHQRTASASRALSSG